MTQGDGRLPAAADRGGPRSATALTVSLDGRSVSGLAGQTIAGVLLGSGVLSWRRTSTTGAPRGLFCGIGVCFDCIITVNGDRDVRACQRRAADGDVLTSQHDLLPADRLPGHGSATDHQ